MRRPSPFRGPRAQFAQAQAGLQQAQVGGTPDQQFDAQDVFNRALESLQRAEARARGATGSGPAQRLDQAFQRFQRVQQQGGTAAEQFDAQLAYRKAQDAQQKAQQQLSGQGGGDFFDRLQSAVLSSRFSMGGGGGGIGGPFGALMPLVGRVTGIFGKLAPQAQALTLGFGLVAESTKTFINAMNDAGQVAGAFGNAVSLSGGTGRDVSRISAMGIPTGEIAGRAAALQHLRSTDPFAALAGGATLPRPFAGSNEAKELEQQLELLQKMTDKEGQLTRARMLGLEWALEYINVSKNVQDVQRESARLTGDIFDQKFLQGARDYNAAQRHLSAAWDRFTTALEKPFIEGATNALLSFAGAIDKVTAAANQHPDALRVGAAAFSVPTSPTGGIDLGQKLGEWILRSGLVPRFNPAALGAGAADYFSRGGKGPDLNPVALGAQAEAWSERVLKSLRGGTMGVGASMGANVGDQEQQMVDALKTLNGTLLMIIHGGGPRSRAAIPPAILAWNNRQAMIDAKLDLRGFRY